MEIWPILEQRLYCKVFSGALEGIVNPYYYYSLSYKDRMMGWQSTITTLHYWSHYRTEEFTAILINVLWLARSEMGQTSLIINN